MRNEREVWKFINKKRRRKEEIPNKITKEEWRMHFIELLKGKEEERKKEQKENYEKEDSKEIGKTEKKGEDDEIDEEEIGTAVWRMKKGKAADTDGGQWSANGGLEI